MIDLLVPAAGEAVLTGIKEAYTVGWVALPVYLVAQATVQTFIKIRLLHPLIQRIDFLEDERNCIPPPMDYEFKPAAAGNYRPGRTYGGKAVKPTIITFHRTGGSIESAIKEFQRPGREGSSSYIVSEDRIVCCVREEDTPYTNRNPLGNVHAITIEMEGWDADAKLKREAHEITEKTLQTAARLARDIAQRHGIPLERSQVKQVKLLPWYWYATSFTPGITIHRDFTNTECPKNFDVEAMIARIKALDSVITVPTVDGIGGSEGGRVTIPAGKTYEPFLIDLHYKDEYDPEVARIQSFLIDKNFMKREDLDWKDKNGLVHIGGGSGWYGWKTSAAVDAFQKANEIYADKDHFGWWYPKTREKANQQLTISN